MADDDPQNRELIGLMLGDAGYQAVFAEDGEEAVREAQRTKVDAILMDIQMPGMSGLAAAQAMRGYEAAHGLKPTPIVALSANAMSHQVDSYLAAGMTAHVAKPIEAAILFQTIEEVMAGLEVSENAPVAASVA